MTRFMLVLSLTVAAVGASGALAAFCPSGNPNEILCEDFDTYCAPGQYPGGAGVPMGTVCPPGTPAAGNDANLQAVWEQTSCIDESLSSLCGTATILDDSFAIDPDRYPASLPFASKHLARTTSAVPISQHTFKDWSTGERNLSRFTENAFGDARFKAVKGEDDAPLVLTFELNADRAGGIFYNDGFIELSFGEPTDPLNRANTDYILATHCWTTCNGLVNQGPFPVVCAMGNPEVMQDGTVGNEACPPIDPPPPIHNAIAVGLLPALDQAPCHCTSGNHGGNSSKPAFFDGQMWWVLAGDNKPYPTTGTVTPLDGACMPEVSDGIPGGFELWGWGGDTGAAHNYITLTIKKDTVIVEHSATFIAKSSTACPYNRWIITSSMELPRKYKGPFDSLRTGVGPGCELSNTSWTSCASGKTRGCITNINNRSRFVEFDDISLYGGAGWVREGACCLSPSGGCVDDVLEADCQALEGGSFRGSTTSCATEVCCPTPYADADVDGDIDAADFGALQVCYTGDTTVSGKCSCFDHNADGKVNQQDVESFIVCANGPAIVPGSWLPECMP